MYKALLLYHFLERRGSALTEWEFILCDLCSESSPSCVGVVFLFMFQLYITSSLMVLPCAVDGKGSQGTQEINLIT